MANSKSWWGSSGRQEAGGGVTNECVWGVTMYTHLLLVWNLALSRTRMSSEDTLHNMRLWSRYRGDRIHVTLVIGSLDWWDVWVCVTRPRHLRVESNKECGHKGCSQTMGPPPQRYTGVRVHTQGSEYTHRVEGLTCTDLQWLWTIIVCNNLVNSQTRDFHTRLLESWPLHSQTQTCPLHEE